MEQQNLHKQIYLISILLVKQSLLKQKNLVFLQFNLIQLIQQPQYLKIQRTQFQQIQFTIKDTINHYPNKLFKANNIHSNMVNHKLLISPLIHMDNLILNLMVRLLYNQLNNMVGINNLLINHILNHIHNLIVNLIKTSNHLNQISH